MSKKEPKNLQTIFVALSMLVVGMTIALVGVELTGNTNTEVLTVQNTEEPEESIAIDLNALEDDDASMGDENAPITVIEFSDYQCPFCRKFYNDTFSQIKENYVDKGLVKLVYRDLPLASLGHKDATPAANAAECAREQEGDEMYFKFHDKIFEGQNLLGQGTVKIPEENLYTYAEELGLNIDEFTTCQESLAFKDEIQADIDVARSIGINGTPSFVINGQIVVGAQPYEVFESIFEQILNQ